jgi:hypothetical protein
MFPVGGERRTATVLALLLMTLAAAPAAAQPASPAPPAQTPPAPAEGAASTELAPALPVDADRIRRALARPATLLPAASTIEVEGTQFRVTVNQKAFNIWEFWGPRETAVSSNVRSWYFSNWHAEYLRMVTPEAGRRAALYPGGMVPAMPGIQAITQAIGNALNARATRKAKEEVQQALEDFFAEHPEARVPAPSAPSKPPS